MKALIFFLLVYRVRKRSKSLLNLKERFQCNFRFKRDKRKTPEETKTKKRPFSNKIVLETSIVKKKAIGKRVGQ